MSYTPPSGNAVNFQGVGFTYAAPSGNAVNFMPTNVATGFCSTQFGTPSVSLDHIGIAEGFCSTQFGTGFVIADRLEQATGFCSTQFGSPESNREEQATSLAPQTQFGTPSIANWAVGFCSTQFGSAVAGRTEYQISQDSTFIPGDPLSMFYGDSGNGFNTYPYWATTSVSTDYGAASVYFQETLESMYGGTVLSAQANNLEPYLEQPGDSYKVEINCQKVPSSGLPDPSFITNFITLSSDHPSGAVSVIYYITLTRKADWGDGSLSAYVSAYAEDSDTSVVLDVYDTFSYVGAALPTSFSLYGSYNIRVEISPASISLYVRTGANEALIGTLAVSFTPTIPVQYVSIQSHGFKINASSVLNTDDGPMIEVINRTIMSMVGTPTARHWFRASSVGMVTRFGTPTTPHDVTCQATGFVSGGVGTPIALPEVSPSPNFFGAAQGFRSTVFGSPSAIRDETSVATGILGTIFGTPQVTVSGSAQGFSCAQFGTPSVANIGVASGFRNTEFGTPIVTREEQVSGFRRTRFGTPHAVESGHHRAYGFCSTRFGHPTGRDSIGGTATGLCSTQFGTPSVAQTHIATAIPPVANFGTPLLVRSPLC